MIPAIFGGVKATARIKFEPFEKDKILLQYNTSIRVE